MKIYIALEEGGGICRAPVPCRALPDGSYEILPDDLFDYEDDSQLFDFGPGDVVLAKNTSLGITKDPCLVAHQLVKSGSEKNEFKRLLFVILEEEPDPAPVLAKYGNSLVRHLLTEGLKEGWGYPGIREWIRLHRHILEEAL